MTGAMTRLANGILNDRCDEKDHARSVHGIGVACI